MSSAKFLKYKLSRYLECAYLLKILHMKHNEFKLLCYVATKTKRCSTCQSAMIVCNYDCRLIKDVERTPLVIPFVHIGMQDVMPIGSKFPSPGKKVDFLDLDYLVHHLHYFPHMVFNDISVILMILRHVITNPKFKVQISSLVDFNLSIFWVA